EAARHVEAGLMLWAAHFVAAVGIGGIEIRVAAADIETCHVPAGAEFDALALALAEIVLDRRIDVDDLVGEVGIKIGHVDQKPVVEQELLYSNVEPSRFLRKKIGIANERAGDEAELLEKRGVGDAGAVASVKPG